LSIGSGLIPLPTVMRVGSDSLGFQMPDRDVLVAIALSAMAIVLVSTLIYRVVRLVRLKRSVEGAWEGLIDCLARRAELVPRLVEIVRGYASFERTALDKVIEARNATTVAVTPSDRARAGHALMSSLKSVVVLADAYPDMKANYAFMSARTQMRDLDRELPRVTQSYNDAVDTYNKRVTGRRSKTLARIMRYRVYDRYQIANIPTV
jgi:LemA protein